MACYKPLKAYRALAVNPSGKRSLVFNPKFGYTDMPVEVPCGQCIGCRLERSRQWAMRCLHEASLHKDSCFITLTYNDENLPDDCSVHVEHFQKFMKRFRKAVAPRKIRFFHCGEYGSNDPNNPKHVRQYGISKLGRPHYHALIFGYDFDDLELVREKDGIRLYHSAMLSGLWPYGFNTVGSVTFESAAYVARYVTKKINGEQAEEHYTRTDPETGEVFHVEPEYVTMSRRPGIGSKWFEEYSGDAYPKDFITVRGKEIKPPKYYDKLLELTDEEMYLSVKAARLRLAKANAPDNTPDRLAQKEKVKLAQAAMLVRPLDKEESSL